MNALSLRTGTLNIRAGLADCLSVRVQLTDGVPVRGLPHPHNPRVSQ